VTAVAFIMFVPLAEVFPIFLYVFFKVIHECDTHNGVGELFEDLGCIINGCAFP